MVNNIKTVIIEDDIQVQDYFASILKNNFNTIEISGYSESVKKSIELINKEKPELVFMDIELNDGLCFEIFSQLNFHEFEVIFVTAYDNYIKKAIDHYAFSFIVKPIESNKIIEVINRYINLKERLFSINKYEMLTSFLASKNSQLLVHIGNQHISIKVNEIIKCVANGNYTYLHLKSGEKHLASKSLKYYEGLLGEKGFFKAHRSIIINIDFITSIYKKETIILTNKDKVHVSVRNKSKLVNLIDSLT